MSAGRVVLPAALALAFALTLSGPPALSGDARAHAHAPSLTAAAAAASRLQVTQVEYRLLLSRGVVHAGSLGLEAINRGSDPHDLHVRAISSGREFVAPELTPGRRWDGVVGLKPGVYRLWCSLPEHAKLGMRATLRVVR
jgi:hypothetical protein